MKLLPVVLFNLAMVLVAVAVYDQLRSEAAPAGTPSESGTEIAALERRIQALEAERRLAAPDPRILERVAALEAAVRVRDAAGGPPTTEPAPDETGPTLGDQPPPAASPDDRDRDAVREFRRLQETVRREESMKRNRVWVDLALDKLQIPLTGKQRTEILAAFAAFEPRKLELWHGASARAQKTMAVGGVVNRGEIVTETNAAIHKEFAESLSGIIPPADAEAISLAMNPGR